MHPQYPTGSEWRKWDLHIHTPNSIIQHYGGDNDSVWNTFIAELASLPPEIKVIAITDYLFCDGYEYLVSRRSEISNIDLIIPNIEFRLNTFSGTANNCRRHNFHVLFDPEVDVRDIKDQLLNALATAYKIEDGTEWHQTPTLRSLEELGRQIKSTAPAGNSIHGKSNREVGFDNITYKREDIEKLLEKTCFKGRFVTAIGYSEWDQSRWDQSAAEKRTLINQAKFCLTSLDDPQKISQNRQDLVENRLNSLILHSSDAHDLNRVGKTLLWVKADPTFAGLKQVLNEPAARIFIGASPPNHKPDHTVIKQICIPSSKGWFPANFSLELNRDLITIVGGRGSGKSALAEVIAYGAGSEDSSEDAFLKKAAKHNDFIVGTEILLEWADGSQMNSKIGTLAADAGLVQYLPQGAVEELCSHKNSEKLQKQIENVIFQALDDADKMGSSDFEELKNKTLSRFAYEKRQELKKINDLNQRLALIISVFQQLPNKKNILSQKKAEKKRLTQSLPELPPEDQEGQECLALLLEIKKKFDEKINDVNEEWHKLAQLESKIRVFSAKVAEFHLEISELLDDLGVSDKSVFSVSINIADIERILEEKKKTIRNMLKTIKEGSKEQVAVLLETDANDLPCNNLQELQRKIEDKQKETQAFETTKLKYQEQKKRILDTDITIKALEREIAQIESKAAAEMEMLEKQRQEKYGSYFELLEKEKNEIQKLYKPLQDSLSAGTDTDKKLVFEAQIKYQLEEHCKCGLDILDRTRKGNFRDAGALKSALRSCFEKCSRAGFERAVLENALDEVHQMFTVFEGNGITIEDQLRENSTIEDFNNWLFDPSHFEIISSLKFNGTDLYLLSPGQKGIVLLMLYLEIDKADYRPLIIDQPEENLDNLSVYKDLIQYFRDRKQYRQIIMVTHNPNLVVNTDAEQVIVANYSGERVPRLQYCSGSLEDQAKQCADMEIDEMEDGIIEKVCDILEGGEPAFSKRKRKYQISTKSRI